MHIIIGKGTEIIATGAAVSDIESLNNSKIGFGIKRADNHEQPDIGKKNITILDKHEAWYMGNKYLPYIYLKFDLGYEAGYTEKILEVLKKENVVGTFFITAHYLNTQPELVKRMIDEGHIVGNHIPNSLKYPIKNIKVKDLQYFCKSFTFNENNVDNRNIFQYN